MMNIKHLLILLSATLLFAEVRPQAGMSPAMTKSVLLTNGTAHIGNGKIILNSLIGIRDGKITEVFNANIVDVNKLNYDTIIDISGKHVYPGFILPNSSLGLREIDAVRATHDYSETGSLNPNVRSIIAYNTDSRLIPTVRSNGILMAQTTPRGSIISGTSSIVALHGWNWEDALYKEDDGIHLNWPRYVNEDVNRKKTGKDSTDTESKRRNEITAIEDFFSESQAYVKTSFNYEINLRYEAMRGIFTGTKKLFIHASHIRELSEAISFKKKLGIPEMVIVGGYDSWRIPELFVDNNIPVILNRLHSLPSRADEEIDLPYKLPVLLHQSGILFCLENAGDMEVMESRNLPFYAGTARAYGLEDELAVQSITLNAAKILGIDKETGSLEPGKDATLFVSTGDALEILTNNVELAFIQGRIMDLDNHQKALYRKYKEKYSRKEN